MSMTSNIHRVTGVTLNGKKFDGFYATEFTATDKDGAEYSITMMSDLPLAVGDVKIVYRVVNPEMLEAA